MNLLDAARFLDEQINILRGDTRRHFCTATALTFLGAGVMLLSLYLGGHEPKPGTTQADIFSSVLKQIVTVGGGFFTAALSISPFKQITPNRKRIAVLRAAKQLPADQLGPIVLEGVREALKA